MDRVSSTLIARCFRYVVVGTASAVATLGLLLCISVLDGSYERLGAQSIPDLHMQELSLTSEGSRVSLPIRIAAESRCFFGDLEVLALDLALSKEPRLLVSVEPVLNTDVAVQPHVVEWHDPTALRAVASKEGFMTSIPLERAAKPQLVGLFICTDSGRTGRCLGKPTVDFDEVMRRHEVGTQIPKGVEIPDKIYFFRFLVVAGDRAQVFQAPMSDARYNLLQQHLESVIGDKAHRDRSVEAIKQLGGKLGSLPLRVQDHRVSLALPWFDQTRCG